MENEKKLKEKIIKLRKKIKEYEDIFYKNKSCTDCRKVLLETEDREITFQCLQCFNRDFRCLD